MAHNKLRTFHLFAGAGGGELADLLLGHIPVGACEIESYPRNVLLQRMRDGILPVHPVWDDICTLDGKPWRGLVDIVCGGFPCQDISAAGKGAGIDGERSGLWGEMARVIREIRPRFAFVENSPMLTARGLHRVLGDLAEMGYDAKWCVLGACDAGAPHKRDRIWILADREGWRLKGAAVADESSQGRQSAKGGGQGVMADSDNSRSQQDPSNSKLRADRTEQSSSNKRTTYKAEGREVAQWWHTDPADLSDANVHDWGDVCGIELAGQTHSKSSESCEIYHSNAEGLQRSHEQSEKQGIRGDSAGSGCTDRPVKPLVGRVAHGVAHRVDRLKAIGNGQVPQCAAMAFNILSRH